MMRKEANMRLPLLVEPIAGGYRASTGSPLNWTAEAATAEAAATTLRDRYSQLLATGARIVDVPLTDSEPIDELAARLGQNPFMEDWAAAVSELRAERPSQTGESQCGSGRMSLFLLDTDTLTLVQHNNLKVLGEINAARAIGHVVGLTTVTLQEQMEGWLKAIKIAKTPEKLVWASRALADA